MKLNDFLLILLILIVIVLFVIAIVFGDEVMTIAGIILGVIILLTISESVLKRFLPKSKISKTPQRIIDWIIDNVRF